MLFMRRRASAQIRISNWWLQNGPAEKMAVIRVGSWAQNALLALTTDVGYRRIRRNSGENIGFPKMT
jgi:hypothetical protein